MKRILQTVTVINNLSTPQLLINAELKSEMIISVSDMNGQIISKEEVMINDGQNLIPVNTGKLSFGIYLIQINNSFESVVRKIIISEEN